MTNELIQLVKPFRCILADPPWAQTMTGKRKRAKGGCAEQLPYGTMTLNDIKAMPVGEWATDDCHLWLWTTNEFLRAGFEVMDAWGFKYLAPVHWMKPSGVGNWFVHRTQTLLFGYRARCRFPADRYKANVIETGDPLAHSAKPDQTYKFIEGISPGPRLEIFARPWTPMFPKRDGWSVWGNEVDCDIDLYSKQQSEELLNCPFCGSRARKFGGGKSQEHELIACTGCAAKMEGRTPRTAWNLRTA